MLQYTWKPRNVYLDDSSTITLETLTGVPVTMPGTPAVSNGNITVTVPGEGNYVVKVKTKNISYAYRITANDSSNDIVPGASTGPNTPKTISVVTGNESRPAGSEIVFWVGGSSAPANMQNNDIWFSTGPVELVDTSAPSVPTGLTSSSITGSGFSLTWNSATDNVGVTGYDIFLDGSLHSSTANLTAALTGLQPVRTYSVAVRAKDAAGNLSGLSTSLPVTTEAAISSPRHSIWGSGNYPYTVTKYTESTPITVANSFYSYGTSPDVSAWRVVGARIWVPAGVTVSQPADVKAWFGANTRLSGTANASATITNWVSGAWNEVVFPTPIETNSSDYVWISYRFGNGDYFATGPAESVNSPTPAFVAASDGSHIVFADNDEPGRAQWRYDNGTAGYASGPGYSIDVIYDEGV